MPEKVQSGAYNLALDRTNETILASLSFGGTDAPELEISHLVKDDGTREQFITLRPSEIVLLREYLQSDLVSKILEEYA